MTGIILYCRIGFEKETGVEIQELAGEIGCYGYFKSQDNSGWLMFQCYQPEHHDLLIKNLPFEKFVFARQWFYFTDEFSNLDPTNRLTEIETCYQALPEIHNIIVEHPDSNEGKELSKFCRKFLVPLRQSLKKANRVSKQSDKTLCCFFVSSTHCFIGYAYQNNMSTLPLGIMRLKHPKNAPSRSTLKLDEAFQTFVSKRDWEERIRPGMNAVDLGACPGGWTYQLVRHGMFVQAIDNGEMSDVVMDTGQVRHFKEDGFVFEPRKKNITWLVCDMVEKPQRVAELMTSWVIKDWCKEAIFNLKLPMKKRFECVQECLEIIKSMMLEAGIKKFQVRARHLYHDREEVTVFLRKRPPKFVPRKVK